MNLNLTRQIRSTFGATTAFITVGAALSISCGEMNLKQESKTSAEVEERDYSTGVIISEQFLNFYANVPGSNMSLLPLISKTLKKAENGKLRLEVSSTEDLLRLRLKKQASMYAPKVEEIAGFDRLSYSHTDDLNAIVSSELAGKLVSSQQIRSIFDELLRPTKSKAPPPAEEEELVKFSQSNPVIFSATKGEFSIVLKIDEFHSGRIYKLPMDIRANYRVSTDKGLSLVKRGDVVILPQNYDPSNPQLSRRQKILIEELQLVFETSFEEVLVPSSEEIEGNPKFILSTKALSADGDTLVVSKRITRK